MDIFLLHKMVNSYPGSPGQYNHCKDSYYELASLCDCSTTWLDSPPLRMQDLQHIPCNRCIQGISHLFDRLSCGKIQEKSAVDLQLVRVLDLLGQSSQKTYPESL